MAQNQEEADGTTTIARVGKRKKGYDVHQVDAFLEQAHALYEAEGIQLHRSDIQDASFDIVKGGYAIPQVDAALERLEQAVTDKQTQHDISELGRVAWKAQTEAQYQRLERHAERAEGERFAPGEAKMPSYDRKQVDRLVDRVLAKAEAELQHLNTSGAPSDDSAADSALTSQVVADVSFTQRKGKRGYDERQVDYYLNACVNLLASLESYARIADYATSAAHAEPDHGTVAPAPLIADHQTKPQTSASYGVTVESDLPTQHVFASSAVAAGDATRPAQSFDELSRAEQEIFAQSQETDAVVPPSFPVARPDAAADAPVVAESSVTEVFTPITDADVRNDDVKHAPTLSDIKPITPAPRTIPDHEKTATAMSDSMSTIPSITAISDETTVAAPSDPVSDFNSPSLAALASLAKTTQDTAVEETSGSMAAVTSGVQPLAVPKLSSILPDLPPVQPLATQPSPSSEPAPASAARVEEAAPAVAPQTTPEPETKTVAAAPEAVQAPSAAADDASKQPASSDNPVRFVQNDGIDIEIPDLSFPTISTDEPLIIDGRPNEKQA